MQRFPTSQDFPPGVMERVSFTAAGAGGWRLSSLRSGPRPEARWRIVVVSGTPSWSEYWAPTIAALPPSMEMIVVDRPGFALSEPQEAVTDLAAQAAALAPLLDAPDGRDIILLGQSYGAPIAALLAAEHPDRVRGLVLMSSYFGVEGRTARRLIAAGRVLRPILPRDLKNAVAEVIAQRDQLPSVRRRLGDVRAPITVLHGRADTFTPPEAAAELAGMLGAAYIETPEGDHFLQACCIAAVIEALETTIARASDPPVLAETGRL